MHKRRLEMLTAAGLAALLLCASPMFVRATDQTTAAKQSAAASDETKPKSAADPSEQVVALKQQMALQQKQIEQMQKALEEQKRLLEQLVKPPATIEQAAQPVKPAAAPGQAVQTPTPNLGQVASTSGMVPKGMIKSETAAGNMAVATLAGARPNPAVPKDETSPLQLKIGDAYITPVGFMDFTSIYRNHDTNGSIGTNFGNIPFSSTGAYQPNLSEFRLSSENSRIGIRVDALVKGAHLLGYMEADFHGFNVTNGSIVTNSNTLRERVYWVDISRGKWEVLGGQTWSLLTPGRKGISGIPGDIFYSQDIDLNYQLGLFFGRIPELRFVYHPTKQVALAVALDSPEQYAGGYGGATSITLPSALNSTSTYQGELDYGGGNTFNTPTLAPDVIVKLAVDPNKRVHFEIGGIERNFRVYNPINMNHYSATGVGGFLNLHVEVVPGLRLLTNNYWSDGGGRYIYGEAPDLIARADGSISPIRSSSTVTGFEFTHKKSQIYGYYGGVYIARNTALDANGTSYIGWGYRGSPNSQNRSIQEATFGFNQTIWKDAKWGAVNFMGQYSYLTRNPWNVPNGTPSSANINMVWFNLRYSLPGSTPTLGK